MLRTKIVNDAPPVEFRMQQNEFLITTHVTVEKDGVLVEMPKQAPQSDDVMYHIGETCEMYRLENLQRAGIRLTTVDVENFIKPNLDRQSRLIDLANDSDFVTQALDALVDKKPLNDVKSENVIDFTNG